MLKKNIIRLFSLFIILITACSSKDEEIKYKAVLSANNEYEANKVSTLLDNDPNTIWNSGQTGVNWIALKYDKNYTISRIQFVSSVSPASNVHVDLMVLDNKSSEFENVYSSDFFCKGNDEIVINKKLENVREIKLVFKNDSSWMSVKSISVIGHENFF